MSDYNQQSTVEVTSTVDLPKDVVDEIRRAVDHQDTAAVDRARDLAFDRLDRTTEFVVDGRPLADVVTGE